ncbi:MIF4G domain containing protein [Trichomonas vaginalis G3]|uniref:MIF4G domain containing protein n=1 Tax=Trichomonas vaginalis (strain ATCC PRA-98 / G3) TaxID=412133 RepID=A2EDU0_TRIV3|nr:nuclear-transcribed mRNA catabolic process, nonsense-mediated decay [Trichomonas vaginalis G3]EAY09156.1 MIF4G domain containing protein [Trichomonas vaginalis G3]KAI5487055.1 nuclear-transcribed mRNA catabolic process, nonsense-mediated decay [Trichomonas vaginalis G3]|eukprot:XP_001321379.1 MIF4G domain containing protein [Trichomonas vaginalis G3]
MYGSFTRTREEIEFRKQRAETYKKLVKLNDSTWKRYSKKQEDDFDDLLGVAVDDGPQINMKGMSPTDVMKATKSCYQRLSTLTRENKDQIIKQINSVKLNKFLEETCSNLLSAKLSTYDIPAFVEVISILHSYYKEFIPLIAPRIVKNCNNQDDVARRRNFIYLYIDLLIVHAVRETEPFSSIFLESLQSDITSQSYSNFTFIWSIIKYAGGDIFGVSRGQDTIIDAIFPENPICPMRKEIFGYFKSLLDAMKQKMDQGRENFEQAYYLIARLGSINSGYMQDAKEERKEYEEYMEKAKCIGFLVNKPVPDEWVDQEEMSELTTIDGVIKIPSRIIAEVAKEKEDKPETQVFTPSMNDNFYDVIADMEVRLLEPLGYDVIQVRKEADRATDSQRIDTLARHYHLIDTPEDRKKLIELFSNINKNKGNQARYLARFVADISQVFTEVGQEISENLFDEYKRFILAASSPRIASQVASKLHLARYIAELAHFKIGIEEYFKCIDFTLDKFRPRTAEMLCTLINIAGKFFDSYCDQTHTNIRRVIEELSARKSEIATHQYALMMVEQTINSIIPPEVEAEPVFYSNAVNEYQAFLIYVFKNEIETEAKPKKLIRYIEKLLIKPEKTKIDLTFIFKLVLDFNSFSAAQLTQLANFVAEFSKLYPNFGIQVADIVSERIHRFLECPSTNYKQRLVMESRFLAELAVKNVVSYEDVLKFMNFILSFNVPNPRHLLIKVEKPKKSQSKDSTTRDFHRIFVVIRMLETLMGRTTNPKYNDQIAKLINHVQLYTITRSPIPATVAFRISDLLDYIALEKKDINAKVTKIETTQQARLINEDPRSTYEIRFLKRPLQIVTNILKLTPELSDEDEDEEDFNEYELYETKFNRERAEFVDLLEQNTKAKNAQHEKITIPLDLMSKQEEFFPRISSQSGPAGPIDFYTSNNKFITIDPADIMK